MWSTALTLSIGGTIMLVVAWLLIGRFAVGRFSVEVLHGRSPARRMTRQQADRTLLLWIAPIIVAPPLLSKDIYSYLAQSAIAYRGMDPYTVSPLHGLGVGNVLTRSVPNLWRDTPAPYGPFFIWIGKGITAVTGDNITAAIFLHRLVALVGLALIVWALPRLARRCGVSPVAALWLGAMNRWSSCIWWVASTTRHSCSGSCWSASSCASARSTVRSGSARRDRGGRPVPGGCCSPEPQ